MFGKLIGRQELRMKVKQKDNIPGSKVRKHGLQMTYRRSDVQLLRLYRDFRSISN